ncbi:related to glucan 1,3-beta-glucosidase [Ramularia collo-cygni]|uniref:glucan 1,3-beta-glucosidase n=1 Tax=Ramularia collo-cygni TaxID=112498 RepID=A0A2D3UMI5_9PEZI|nr:related to glucan 1,3-beta-glucosidase [Ramularia collo-cygni]CZT16552.1 related to glucan 1,3-beta-glucosidase [Ramularia collo-cygni]
MPASSSQVPRDSPARRQRRRRTHQRTDSNGELLGNYDEDAIPASPGRARRSHHERRSSRTPRSEQTRTSSTALSSEQLARLDRLNQNQGWSEYERVPQPRRVDREDEIRAERARAERDEKDREERRERERQRRRDERRRRRREEAEAEASLDEQEREELAYEPRRTKRRSERRSQRPERRVISGQTLERGAGRYYSDKEEFRDDVREGTSSSAVSAEEGERKRKRKRNILIGVAIIIIALAIIIPVAVVVSKKSGSSSTEKTGGTSTGGSSKPSNSNLDSISKDDIPQAAQGTVLDPFTWYDTLDFNLTYTDATVGGLSVMGLNSTWDDSKRANNNVPPLNKPFEYGKMPIRGVNVGGWLSLEPFITPSFFSRFTTSDGVIDEWTLTERLGGQAKSTIETHYSSWVQESTFADIQAAGFDHVRIPFSYWAVTTYDGDPYVAQVSWRYMLRGIEWARKYGLRINLDLHGAPGSQNGWNHSGRQGIIRWLNGTDGTLNGDRTIDIHKQLSAFFTQPRYKNIVTMYGLVNEPRMVKLEESTVIAWTKAAAEAVRGNNFTGIIVFGDGFMGLDNWQGELQGIDDLLLDVHQYVIFNVDQIVLNHQDKINFACGGWTAQALRSQNTATGFGPTLCGEWSQADTDCAPNLNNVGVGSRWEGTLNMVSTPGGGVDGSILNPTCPTKNSPRCSCDGANASPSEWSDGYKQWLLMFAEAQMHSFEQGWGWFYWTWQTESAPQWSYKTSLAAGTMPKLAYERSFNCSSDIPDFSDLPEYY